MIELLPGSAVWRAAWLCPAGVVAGVDAEVEVGIRGATVTDLSRRFGRCAGRRWERDWISEKSLSKDDVEKMEEA